MNYLLHADASVGFYKHAHVFLAKNSLQNICNGPRLTFQTFSTQAEIIEFGINKTRTNCVFVGMQNNKSVIRKKKKRSTGPSNRNSNEAFCYGRK